MQCAKVYDSEFDDYRDIDEKEKIDYINKNFNMLSIHKELSKLDSIKTQID